MRVKICGITNVDDAVAAANLGADAIGLNFYPKSPRSITEETAREIIQRLPLFVEPVGLFVNRPLQELADWAQKFELIRTIQVHADAHEPIPETTIRIIPAFSVRDEQSLLDIQLYLDRCRERGPMPAAILVDAHVKGMYGGTGVTAPWQLLAEFQPDVPLILAGGLTPENVSDAVRLVRPYAVDVASGVESNPGKKDHKKMEQFFRRAREAIAD